VLYLDKPVVVGVTSEAVHSVSGHLVLKFDIGDWWTDVVRVEMLMSCYVAQLDAHPRCYMRQGGRLIKERILCGAVDNYPVVIVVSMRIEGDLLFCGRRLGAKEDEWDISVLTFAAGWVIVGVGVEISTLGVHMAYSNLRAESHIWRIDQ
jgi:hypothetical protein